MCQVYLPTAGVTVLVPADERLTKDNSARLRDPASWEVEELLPGVWNAAMHQPLAAMQVHRGSCPGEVTVLSNTGGQYTVNVVDETCECVYYERNAPACCKHLAAAIAVARWLRERKRVREARVREKEARRDVRRAA